jgi:hypothetical protein
MNEFKAIRVPTLDAPLLRLAASLDTFAKAVSASAVAFVNFGAAIDAAIARAVEQLTPVQRERYQQLVDAGMPKLDAVVEASMAWRSTEG